MKNENKITMENKKDETMMSLFNYLNIAAGSELGTEVYKTALKFGVKTETKDVVTKTYSGKIKLYPRYFLDFYFINYRPWEERIAATEQSSTKQSPVEYISLPF